LASFPAVFIEARVLVGGVQILANAGYSATTPSGNNALRQQRFQQQRFQQQRFQQQR
jgi:hypothetical protein